MAKGKLLEDTFEQLVELGSSMAKKSAQQVTATFNPLNLANNNGEQTSEVNSEQKNQARTSEVKHGKDHTPLDFDKLKNKFQNKDKLKTEALRNRLFQIVKQEDEKTMERKDMEEAQKKRQEEYLNQEKKRKEHEKKHQKQYGNIPEGIVRRSIFSSKKVAEREHAEFKPASGKQ